MTSIARYPDECTRCAGPINPGHVVRRASGGWEHATCPDEPDLYVAPQPTPRPPRRHFNPTTHRRKGRRP